MNYTRLEHDNPLHSDIITINWCMGNACNFSCSYCPESLRDGSIGWHRYDDVVAFCDKAIEHYKGKTIYFEFTGGEITLWNQFVDLCRYLKSKDVKVGVLSNGSRSIEWWETITPYLDHACLSYHHERGYADHFVKVVKYISQFFRTHVNVMMMPDKFNELYEYATKISKVKNISIALQPLMVNFQNELYDYTPIQKKLLDNQHNLIGKHIVYDRDFQSYRGAMAMVGEHKQVASPQHLVATQQNSWLDWKCSAGLEQIVVHTDGTIYRGWCEVGGAIGHILDKDLQLPTEKVICTKKICSSIFDIMSSKEQNDE